MVANNGWFVYNQFLMIMGDPAFKTSEIYAGDASPKKDARFTQRFTVIDLALPDIFS